MARFYPLYVRRSDGKIELVSKGKRKERNEPTADQLDQSPDKNGISDFYREVGIDEVKHLDWRRKLGGMLVRELQGKEGSAQDNGYMLVSFPENYRLYEHVKKTETDGTTEVKTKTHAGGGNDRQDAYLYGHPQGRRKRFRSPADFFPHLLWLCTDESGDPDNCSCKICSPEDLDSIVPGAKVKIEQPKVANKQAETVTTRQPTLQNVKLEQRPTPSLVAQPTPSTKPLVPTPLVAARTQDQQVDCHPGTFIYRPGESVWFQRGQAWGLGVVVQRWSPSPNEQIYQVQPLSYPGRDQPPVTKTSNQELRPWLAWSVPKYTNAGLNDLTPPPTYDTADFAAIQQKRFGNGDLEVDASILAAKAIDTSYTPFQLLSTTQPRSGVQEYRYNGIYLGGEKIWTGEPIRLALGPSHDIMVLHSILERRTSNHSSTLHFIGDIYKLALIPHSDPSIPTPASAHRNPHMPPRVTEDLAYRNARSIAVKRTASYWQLHAAQVEIGINDVKGRWYAASVILPILQEQSFEQAARSGDIPEASVWMNARLDCLNINRAENLPRVQKYNIRKGTRQEAIGRAIPPGRSAFFEDGAPPQQQQQRPTSSNTTLPAQQQQQRQNVVDLTQGAGQDAMEVDPRFATADSGDAARNPGANAAPAAGLGDYLNLDSMGDYGQGY